MENINVCEDDKKMYVMTNEYGKPYYDIHTIARLYDLKPAIQIDNVLLVLLSKNEIIDLRESYPGIGIHSYQTRSYFE